MTLQEALKAATEIENFIDDSIEAEQFEEALKVLTLLRCVVDENWMYINDLS